jgi:hypothetical protein
VRGDGSVDGSMSTINPRRDGRERGRSASFDPIHRSLGRICQQRERDRERERERQGVVEVMKGQVRWRRWRDGDNDNPKP